MSIVKPDITVVQVDGALTVAAGVARIVAPTAGRIIGATANVRTAPGTNPVLVDVNVAGTSIFAVAGDRLSIPVGANDAAPAGATADETVTDFVAGDVITVDVDQIGTTPAGSDLTVALSIVADETPA